MQQIQGNRGNAYFPPKLRNKESELLVLHHFLRKTTPQIACCPLKPLLLFSAVSEKQVIYSYPSNKPRSTKFSSFFFFFFPEHVFTSRYVFSLQELSRPHAEMAPLHAISYPMYDKYKMIKSFLEVQTV